MIEKINLPINKIPVSSSFTVDKVPLVALLLTGPSLVTFPAAAVIPAIILNEFTRLEMLAITRAGVKDSRTTTKSLGDALSLFYGRLVIARFFRLLILD